MRNFEIEFNQLLFLKTLQLFSKTSGRMFFAINLWYALTG